MTPSCTIHNDTYFPPGGQCILCLRGSVSKKRIVEKATNSISKTYNKKLVQIEKQNQKKKENQQLVKELLKNNPDAKIIKQPKSRKQLIEEGQKYLSLNWKKKYCPNKTTNCSVCNKPVPTKGNHIMNTIHCGHYYAKGIYWQLMFDESNLAPVCYDHNVNKPESAPGMRDWLIKTHGKKAIELLDQRATKFMQDKNQNIIKSRPDELYLLGNIQDQKKRTKKEII